MVNQLVNDLNVLNAQAEGTEHSEGTCGVGGEA